jgi:hypothetical protein
MPVGIHQKICLLLFFNEFILRALLGLWDLLPDTPQVIRNGQNRTEIGKYNSKAS